MSALRWLEEADATGTGLRKAGAAAGDVLADRLRLERAAAEKIAGRLDTLRSSLRRRILADDGSTTDFRRFALQSLLRDVDAMYTAATVDITRGAEPDIRKAETLGAHYADEPVRAAGLQIPGAQVGLDPELVSVAFDNLAGLLSQPMQQFRGDVVSAIRRVALAGDGRFQAISQLRDVIGGQGFDNAQYRAERIIRTEVSRVFNESTYGRLTQLASTFPFLRKGWRATNDKRTRATHQAAGVKYARGSLGVIPIADRFLVGGVLMRFPVDPLAEPGGKVAAKETIMCRCNAFVDFDLQQYGDHVAKTIRAVGPGGAVPEPTPAPLPLPVPIPIEPKAPAPKPRAVRALKVKTPTAAAAQAGGTAIPMATSVGPLGTKVSASFLPTTVRALKSYQVKAMAAIDAVHGDGPLKATKFIGGAANHYGQFQAGGLVRGKGRMRYRTVIREQAIQLTKRGIEAHPLMTVAHEVGHWIDYDGMGGSNRFLTHNEPGAVADWLQAAKQSRTVQRLREWYTTPEAGPRFKAYDHLKYLLQNYEVWARSYAQYVAVRSGDPEMLGELRRMQKATAAASNGLVTKESTLSSKSVGAHEPGEDYATGKTYSYPYVWQDDEFEPIAAAFDRYFEGKGWRGKTK